ncbi:MAG: 4-coumarate--CoA ligase family protein [Anaerolineales bacterium]|nr:4-coumarate--CoA ligase family protein [Anaerolineales bacterium]
MIFRSPIPDIPIPDVPLTPLVLRKAAEMPTKPALIDGPSGRTITYGQLAGAVRLVASSLLARGFKKGDVFAIYSPNIPEYAIAFHAVSLAGGINTTANPLYTAEELAFQLNDSGAKFLLTVPMFLDKALEAAKHSKVEEVFVFGEAEGATPFAALLKGDGNVPDPGIHSAEDLVVLPYSSGTTGLPKGVMLTHRNLIANILQTAPVETISADDVLVGILPFFHIYGMLVIMNASLYHGATVITMPRFDMEQFLQLVQQYKISRAHLVPPIVLGLTKHPIVDKYDLSSLKVIISGAAPLGADLTQACAARLKCIVKQGYGLTETSPVTHVDVDDSSKIKPGSVGQPIPNTEVRVVDPIAGKDLGHNERGEVWLRGPQVMKGYLNNPQATAMTIDSDGWLHTGDIGYADDESYFYIVDRVKELIKYKGMQVAPAELEAILLTHPAIADAAVIPIPDEEAGEIPKAFVVLKGETTPEAIMDYVAGKVAPHKKVRQLEIVDQIPKSASGKILRRILVDKERAKMGDD